MIPQSIRYAHLTANDSPRKAFYKIWIEGENGVYRVKKESGIKDKVLDRRSWPFESFEAAKGLYEKRIRYKTNMKAKRKRKYKLVKETGNA